MPRSQPATGQELAVIEGDLDRVTLDWAFG